MSGSRGSPCILLFEIQRFLCYVCTQTSVRRNVFSKRIMSLMVKVKDNAHPITGHEGLDEGWMVNTTPRPLYPRLRDPVPIVKRLGGSHGRSGRVWKISPPPTCIRSSGRPARSDSLYRLSYPGPTGSCP